MVTTSHNFPSKITSNQDSFDYRTHPLTSNSTPSAKESLGSSELSSTDGNHGSAVDFPAYPIPMHKGPSSHSLKPLGNSGPFYNNGFGSVMPRPSVCTPVESKITVPTS